MPVSQCNFESIQEKQGADGQSHTINCLLSRQRSTKDIPSPFLPLKHPVHFAATNTGSFLERPTLGKKYRSTSKYKLFLTHLIQPDGKLQVGNSTLETEMQTEISRTGAFVQLLHSLPCSLQSVLGTIPVITSRFSSVYCIFM